MAIVPCLQKNPISKLQEFAQQGRIFSPKYEDLTSAEGQPGWKFVFQVYTRSKVPVNNANCLYTQLGYDQFYYGYGNYHYKDYSCKGFGSSKREAKTGAAAKLLSLLCGVKNPHTSSYSLIEKEAKDAPQCKKNPISVVHEYAQRNALELSFNDGIEHGMFSCKLVLGKLDTTGIGMCKRSAKSAAAVKMIKILENIKEEENGDMKPLIASDHSATKNKSKSKTKRGSRVRNNSKSKSQDKDDYSPPMFDLSSGKHPISLLQEFCQKRCLELPVYSRKGIFTTQHPRNRVQNFDMLVTIKVGGKEYFASGCGTTIKGAKTMAAGNMIKRLENARDEMQASLLNLNANNANNTNASKTTTTSKPSTEKSSTESKTEKSKIFELDPQSQMNPLALVNQLFSPEVIIDETPDKPDHRKEFVVTLKIGTDTYKGTANSKKNAKVIAAAACLEDKVGHCQYNTAAMEQTWNAEEFTPAELAFAKTVSNLVHQKYELVSKDMPEHEQKRKVLAGILIRSSEKKPTPQSEVSGIDDLQVLVVTTGTKCVDGSKLSSNGQALNDSHAEILARRAFKRFLLEQIKRFHNKESSILEKSKVPPFLLTVKPGLSFHLYISTSPCGDARIYNMASPSESSAVPDNKRVRGVLRSKIECGEGTIPVSNMNPVQTWDGVLAGERLCTMSCSDKLSIWNVAGVQGAILTHFMEPVYIDTVIIGGCFSLYHITRALVTRVESCEDLPDCYKIHRPLILPVSQQEQRVPCKSSGYSMNWILGEGSVEVTRTNIGKCIDDASSRLCKNSLFQKFNEVCEAVAGSKPYAGRLYLDIKNDATNYQQAKNKIVENFKKGGFGNWIKKPVEQDMFSI